MTGSLESLGFGGGRRYAENRKFVDSLRLFDALTSRQKDCFAEEVFAEVFETPGDRVVTQGETSSAIHFVKSGELQAFSGGTVTTLGKHEGGKQVAKFKAGESFGEHSMLYKEPHQNTVITMTKCELLVIGRESMIKVLGNDYKDFLERNFLSAGLRKSQEISHLNFEQQKALMEIMTVKKLPPNDRVESGLRFAIVVVAIVLREQLGASLTLLARRVRCGSAASQVRAASWTPHEAPRAGAAPRGRLAGAPRAWGARRSLATLQARAASWRRVQDWRLVGAW
ncbi:unnamed protein product [Prorocentrum cordatum]|uniref:Cyclic nucleotide-binding domain-containing protein n=1 Tax=Prorocentrum cordatum TaxID=2364126 RepID=A0ABN9WWF5_9DINO|nr:unnamed protein product [Polarella glacialis]